MPRHDKTPVSDKDNFKASLILQLAWFLFNINLVNVNRFATNAFSLSNVINLILHDKFPAEI